MYKLFVIRSDNINNEKYTSNKKTSRELYKNKEKPSQRYRELQLQYEIRFNFSGSDQRNLENTEKLTKK
jgi:hypothetical protein